jgi:hypothetical protein
MAHKKHYHYLVYPFCENKNFEIIKIYNVIALDSSIYIENGNENTISWLKRSVNDTVKITEKITGIILIYINSNGTGNVTIILY